MSMTKVTHLTLEDGGSLNRRRIHLHEISDDADAPLETVGQDLRAARLRRGVDLATVSRALKIRKDHLESLEEDRVEALPGRAYAIGFVRSYADFLGLDPVETVERFKREIAGRDETPKSSFLEDSGDERRLPQGWVIIAIVVLGLVLYGGYWLVRSADSFFSEPVAPVPARMTAAEQEPAATAAQPPAPQAVAAQPAPKAAAPAPTQPAAPTTTASIAASPTPAQTPAKTAPVPPQGRTYGLRNANPRVILHVLAPTRMLVEGANGMVYINRALKPGDKYRVPDLVGLTLTTPNAGAVEIELDGQMMGTAGGNKQVAEAMPLDPQAIVDRYDGRQQN